MKKFGLFLIMLTLVGYTVGCSKPETPETPAAPPADSGDEADTTTPAEG